MREVTADKSRARSLLKMSKKVLRRIESTDSEKFSSQVLRDYYSVTHQLMEAISSLKGIKIEGRGAHRKLVDWSSDECGLPEKDRCFLQQLRRNRNRISYEGFFIKAEYLKRNQRKMDEVIDKLRDELEKRLNYQA